MIILDIKQTPPQFQISPLNQVRTYVRRFIFKKLFLAVLKYLKKLDMRVVPQSLGTLTGILKDWWTIGSVIPLNLCLLLTALVSITLNHMREGSANIFRKKISDDESRYITRSWRCGIHLNCHPIEFSDGPSTFEHYDTERGIPAVISYTMANRHKGAGCWRNILDMH